MDDVDHLISHLHMVGDDDFVFAVPLDTPPELKASMFAAWKTYGVGGESIDQVLERYGPAWAFDQENRTDLQVFVDDIVIPSLAFVRESIECWAGPTVVHDTVSRTATGAAMMRLHSSFNALALLARYAYGFEAFAVSRLILEELAWVVAVHELEDDAERIVATRPQSCLTHLKGVLPWAGRLYGELSSFSHSDPKLAREYVTRSGDAFAVMLRRPTRWSPRLAWVYALLAHGYVVVANLVFDGHDPVDVGGSRALVEQASEYAMFDIGDTL